MLYESYRINSPVATTKIPKPHSTTSGNYLTRIIRSENVFATPSERRIVIFFEKKKTTIVSFLHPVQSPERTMVEYL